MTDHSHLENELEDNDLCKIRIYNKRDKRVPVFITSFSQGALNIENNNQLKFECFKKEEDEIGINAERKLIAHNGRLNYIGCSNTPLMKHFIGVRNKTTGKMKLYDSVLFHLKPDVKNNEPGIPTDTTPKTYWENINDLTQSFGSKAKKRALETILKLQVDKSQDESLTLNNLPEQLLTDASLLEEPQQNLDYLPPQNRTASCVEDVFDINCIISPEEDASLDWEVQSLLTAPVDVMMERRSSFCAYVSERFANVSNTKAKYLLYYDYLVKFQKVKFADIKKKDPVPQIPQPYKKCILDKFTVLSTNEKGRTSRNLPPKIKDKLISYIFVLALIIDDFKVNINLMVKDLYKVNIKKIITIVQALGCHVTSKKMGKEIEKCAELKLPLFVLVPNKAKKITRR